MDKEKLLKLIKAIQSGDVKVSVIDLRDGRQECLHTEALFDLVKYMAGELAHEEDYAIPFWWENLAAVFRIRKKSVCDCEAWQALIERYDESPPDDERLVGRHDRLNRKFQELRSRTLEHENDD